MCWAHTSRNIDNLQQFQQLAIQTTFKVKTGIKQKRKSSPWSRDDPIEQFEDNLNIEKYGEETVAVIRNILLPRASKRLKLKK